MSHLSQYHPLDHGGSRDRGAGNGGDEVVGEGIDG